MKKRLPLLLIVCFVVDSFCLSSPAQTVEPGMARVHVLQILGEPASAISRGETEYLTYRDGTKVTLIQGIVSEATGLPETPAETVSPPIETPPEEASIQIYDENAQVVPETVESSNFAQAISQLESHSSPQDIYAPANRFSLIELFAGIFLKTIVTILALKLTSKYWGYEILWGGIIVVAIVDTTVRTGVTAGAKYLLGFPTTFYADEAIAALVMVMLVQKMSTSQSLNQAIQITLTTKVFTIVAGSFLVTMALQLLH